MRNLDEESYAAYDTFTTQWHKTTRFLFALSFLTLLSSAISAVVSWIFCDIVLCYLIMITGTIAACTYFSSAMECVKIVKPPDDEDKPALHSQEFSEN